MKERPKVSVIVLNYNGKDLLRECLPSVLNQTYRDYEVIVVDNASTDGSVEYVKENFPSVRIVRNPQNYGFAEGNNIGAKNARGEFIIFLNNDTKVTEIFVEEMTRCLEEGGETVASVICKLVSWDGSQVQRGGDEVTEMLAGCGPAGIYRKKAFFEAGGFDRKFFIVYEDDDLAIRLASLGYKILYTPRAVVYHRSGGALRDSPFLTFLFTRNLLMLLAKNFGLWNSFKFVLLHTLLSAHRHVFTNLLRLAKRVLVKPKPGSPPSSLIKLWIYFAIRAYIGFLKSIPYIIAERRIIRSRRRVSDREIIKKFFYRRPRRVLL